MRAASDHGHHVIDLELTYVAFGSAVHATAVLAAEQGLLLPGLKGSAPGGPDVPSSSLHADHQVDDQVGAKERVAGQKRQLLAEHEEECANDSRSRDGRQEDEQSRQEPQRLEDDVRGYACDSGHSRGCGERHDADGKRDGPGDYEDYQADCEDNRPGCYAEDR